MSTATRPVPPAPDRAPTICIGVCTFRRPSQLRDLLLALQSLTFTRLPAPMLRLLVVDNAPEGGARRVVEAVGWDGAEVIHVGASNIATARNVVLERGTRDADLLAIIDDDEVPTPEWLEELLLVQQRTAADLVVGPVVPRFPDGTPKWLAEGGFFDLDAPADGARLDEGITGNALLVSARIEELGLRFDESLGAAGGEDQLFFRVAVHRGAEIRYASHALVHEPVPQDRLRTSYLLRREFRKGNTLGLLDRGAPGWPPPAPLTRVAKALLWVTRGMLVALQGVVARRREQVVHGALQCSRAVGMAVGLVGRRFDAYGRGQRTDTGATPTIVLVAAEDPRVQDAGHSQFLAGFLRHFQALGCRVVLLVTTGRVGFLAASAAAGYEVRSPGTVRVGRFTVARPKAALRHLAWLTFVGAPAPAQRAVDGVRSWWRGRRTVDHVLGHPVEGELARWVNTELEALAPDAVLFNTLFSVPDPLALPAGASGHIITVDVMSERAAAFARIGYGVHPPNFGADDEAAALARLPHLIAIQWDDAAHFRALLPDATVVVAPVVVDAGPVPIRTPIPGRCVFVGSGALHNVDGIRWFIAECWPAIRAGRPDAELHVIGTVCARLGAAPPGVVLRGRVDDLAPEYAAAAAVVVPLRAGSGLKVKLVDALCHGVPVVTTPTGAQGLMAIEPPPFEVAEDPDAFAAAVERVLADPSWGQELERRAATVASRFSSDEAFRELDDDLRSRGVRLPAPETGMNP